MQIEILVEGEEPVIYPIRDNKIVIGSGEAANIHLPPSSGVSRKHLEILIEGDKFFVKDLGSTNGTFINDERLVPGSKTPFTSFFPVMLGETVTVSLLSDDDKGTRRVAETIAIPKKDSKKISTLDASEVAEAGTKTKTLVSTKEKARARPGPMIYKKADPKSARLSDNARMVMAMGVVTVIIGLGAFYKLHLSSAKTPSETVTESHAQKTIPKTILQAKIPTGPLVVADDQVPPVDEIQRAFADFKCSTTIEKKICDVLPETENSRSGVIVNIDNILVMLPEEKWYADIFMDKNTHLYVNHALSAQEKTIYLTLLALGQFKPFNWEELDKNLFFIFYRMKDNAPSLSSVVGIVPKELNVLMKNYPTTIIAPPTAYSRAVNVLPSYAAILKVFRPTDWPDMAPPEDLTGPLKPLPAAAN